MDFEKHVYHLDVENVSENVILCGRRNRALDIIKRIKGNVLADDDFIVGEGRFKGKDITVCSHGIGGPSIAIVVRELAALGARRFVRVGSAGALHTSVNVGDIVIVTGSVRDDGSEHIARIELPAIASPDVVNSLVASSKRAKLPQGSRLHVGIAHSKYDFFSEMPELTMDERATRAKWGQMRNLGVLCSEMECGTLFVTCMALSQRLGQDIKSGAIVVCAGRVEGEPYTSNKALQKKVELATDASIEIALDALAK